MSDDNTPLTDEERVELRRRAEAAEQGEWSDAGYGYVVQRNANGDDEPGMPGVVRIALLEWEEGGDPSWSAKGMENAQHIASANPSTVLRLLDENAALRAERDEQAARSDAYVLQLREAHVRQGTHDDEMQAMRDLVFAARVSISDKATEAAHATEQRVVAAIVWKLREDSLMRDSMGEDTPEERLLCKFADELADNIEAGKWRAYLAAGDGEVG